MLKTGRKYNSSRRSGQNGQSGSRYEMKSNGPQIIRPRLQVVPKQKETTKQKEGFFKWLFRVLTT